MAAVKTDVARLTAQLASAFASVYLERGDITAGGVWLGFNCGLLRTSVDNVADRFGAKRVVQWNSDQGVCVTGQLGDGPLRDKNKKHK